MTHQFRRPALGVLCLLLAVLGALAPATASAATPTSATPAAAPSVVAPAVSPSAAAASTCLTTGYPSGRYFVVFVYRGGTKKYCNYPDVFSWLGGIQGGVVRGVGDVSGYSSIYARDAGTGSEASGHFNCYSAGRQCAITTDVVSAGPSTTNWQFGNSNTCATIYDTPGRSTETQAVRYWMQNVAAVQAGTYRATTIAPPGGNETSYEPSCNPYP